MSLINPNPGEFRDWINGELANASKMNTIRDDLRKLQPIGVKHYTTVNGVFVNTPGTQQAIDEMIATGAHDTFLYFPVGDWIMDGTLVVQGADGFVITGEGHGTAINWFGAGSPNGPMWYFAGSRFTVMQMMKLAVGDGSQSIEAMIVQEQDGLPGSGPSSQNTFRHMRLEGLGAMERGIYMKGDGTDANNDFATFERLFIGGYTDEAVLLQGANCLNNYFHNCQLAGQRTGNYGIKSIVGAGGQSAHYCVYGGSSLGHLASDYYLQNRCAQPVVIDNVWSEGSERFFGMATGNGSACSIAIRNVTWNSDTTTDPDEWVCVFGVPGPIVVEGCIFGGGGADPYAKSLRMLWSYSGGFFAPSFVVKDTNILGAETVLTDIFQGTRPTKVENVFAQTADDAYVELSRLRLPNNIAYAARNAADTVDIPIALVNGSNEIVIGDDEVLRLQSLVQEQIHINCGLTFPGTPIAPFNNNTLHQYEVGGWNPTVPGSLASSDAAYVKIGRLCVASARLIWSSKGTFSQMLIEDLPFVANSANAAAVTFGTPLNLLATDIVALHGTVTPSSTQFNVTKTRDTVDASGGTPADITDADWDDDTELVFTVAYVTLT